MTSNYGEDGPTMEEKIRMLKKGVSDGKHVFVLIFMNGCGPCKETKPKWKEIEEKFNYDNNKHDIVMVDIEKDFLQEVANIIGEDPLGFPTMRHIKGGEVEDYENSAVSEKNRSPESFEEWVNLKIGTKKQTSGGSLSRTKKRRNKQRGRTKRGGKWSLKYKKSINCRHPKGFSQRQHCKYGRKYKK